MLRTSFPLPGVQAVSQPFLLGSVPQISLSILFATSDHGVAARPIGQNVSRARCIPSVTTVTWLLPVKNSQDNLRFGKLRPDRISANRAV